MRSKYPQTVCKYITLSFLVDPSGKNRSGKQALIFKEGIFNQFFFL